MSSVSTRLQAKPDKRPAPRELHTVKALTRGHRATGNTGISLPGTGEAPAAPVFIDSQKAMTLRGENIARDFVGVIEDYVARTYQPIATA